MSAHSLSQQVGYPDLSALPFASATVFAATNRAIDALTAQNLTQRRPGTVAVVTHLVGHQPGVIAGAGGTAPFYRTAGSPASCGDDYTRLQFVNIEQATPANFLPEFQFFQFERNELFHGSPLLSCPPDTPVAWKPRHPIVLPPGWNLRVRSMGAGQGGFAAYGYVLDVETARALGYDVGADFSPSSGIKRTGYTGLMATNGTQTLVAARAGQCIQILDIYARLQPKSLSGASMAIKAATTGNIFVLRNDSPSNTQEWKFSPGLFLPVNEALQLVGDAGAAARGSVNVIFRYVDQDQVPPEHFWGHSVPALPSPGGTTVTTNVKRQSTTFTLVYPRLGTTKTVPGAGLRHHIEGYLISAFKDSTATSDLTWFSLGAGTAGGNVGFNTLTLSTANKPIAPIASLGAPNQGLNLVVDQVNIPCVANTGLIIFDALSIAGSGLATPAGEGDIAGWSATVWGRTMPTQQGTTDNFQFEGSPN